MTMEQNIKMQLPTEARHKLFGKVEVVGLRVKCEENNNLMYLVITENGKYFWTYDYETDFSNGAGNTDNKNFITDN